MQRLLIAVMCLLVSIAVTARCCPGPCCQDEPTNYVKLLKKGYSLAKISAIAEANVRRRNKRIDELVGKLVKMKKAQLKARKKKAVK